MKKRMKRKPIIIIIISILILVLALGTFLWIKKDAERRRENDQERQDKELVELIKSKFNEFATVDKESTIYIYEDGNFNEHGRIFPGIELALETEEITKDTKYFKITNLDREFHVGFENIVPLEELTEISNRHKRYIPFNQNVVIEDITTFYKDGEKYIELNESSSLPILMRTQDRFYVEYNDELVYVLREGTTVVDNQNTTRSNTRGIPTILYHFIFDPAAGDRCDQSICHTITKFRSHMEYIKRNNYFTPTMDEFEHWIDGNLRLPKSVVITLDDGWFSELFFSTMKEMELNGTAFLIGKDYGGMVKYENEFVEVHSHSYDMHKHRPRDHQCPGQGNQGGGILCLPREHVLEDLRKTREMFNNTRVFAYPFFDFNDRAISLLREAGFTMAFAGYLNNTSVMRVGGNKMLIPRFTIFSDTTVNMLSRELNSI